MKQFDKMAVNQLSSLSPESSSRTAMEATPTTAEVDPNLPFSRRARMSHRYHHTFPRHYHISGPLGCLSPPGSRTLVLALLVLVLVMCAGPVDGIRCYTDIEATKVIDFHK